MNEPRVVESVTNECQLLGRAHESSSARAEQLIACLECEIDKRDEELAACRVAVENCELFRARIAELEARIVWLECEAQVNAAPVSEAKAQGVVMPRNIEKSFLEWASAQLKAPTQLAAYMAGADEVARLNAAPVQRVSVPEGLELIKRMQVCLSFDDTEWGLSAPEKYKLLGDIKSYVLAAPAAPAADAGGER